MIRQITSRSNPRLKALIADREQYYFFEGEKLVRDLVEKKIPLAILIVNNRHESQAENLRQQAEEVWLVSEPVFKKLSSLKTHSDFLAVVRYQSPEINLAEQPLIVALDRIQDPANAGTVFRCAAAFGIRTILLCGESVKPTNPKFIRTAQTSLFDIQFQHYPHIHDLINRARELQLNIYMTSSKISTQQIEPNKIKTPALVIFGNEGQGLAPELLDQFPIVTIAQKDCVESLNVGVSACIIMYQLMKNLNL
jgi:TrmH family RNA methyltransferase